MNRFVRIVRRHWRVLIVIACVTIVAARPDLLQSAVEQALQFALNVIAAILGAVLTAANNVITRNGRLLENLIVLAIVIFGLRIILRGLFKRSR